MFAARDLNVGERVIAERPLACWTVREGESKESRLKAFAKVMEGMSTAQRQTFFSLSQASHLSATGERTAYSTWVTNALPIDYESSDGSTDSSGVFATICRLNHACTPNCMHEWNAALQMETIHVLSPLKRGDELTISCACALAHSRPTIHPYAHITSREDIRRA